MVTRAPEPTVGELHERFVVIVGEVDAVDIREYEACDLDEIRRGLEPRVRATLAEARKALGRALELYDGASDPPATPVASADHDLDRAFDLDVDTLVHQLPSAGRVSDLAFIASLELRHRTEVIDRLTGARDCWQLLSALDSALRRVRKSLTAVATVLCAHEGIEPVLSFASELQVSLEVRRVYARFREAVGAAAPQSGEALHAGLRGIGTQIAILVGRPVYRSLRVSDRIQLRTLQERILQWLRTEDDTERSRLAGARLWQDVMGFAHMISHVSRRQELLEHDARVVTIATGSLFGASERRDVPEGLFRRLAELYGLDDDVDRLIREQCTEVRAWREPLERIAARFDLDRRGGGGAAFTEAPWGNCV